MTPNKGEGGEGSPRERERARGKTKTYADAVAAVKGGRGAGVAAADADEAAAGLEARDGVAPHGFELGVVVRVVEDPAGDDKVVGGAQAGQQAVEQAGLGGVALVAADDVGVSAAPAGGGGDGLGLGARA